MRVYLNGHYCGKSIFDITYLRGELLVLYKNKEPLYNDGFDLGYIKKATIKPNKVTILTNLLYKIEFVD